MARQELIDASDAVIDDAIGHADPLVLRGLLYQLTGDERIAAIPTAMVPLGFRGDGPAIVDPGDLALLRDTAAAFLKAYRNAFGRSSVNNVFHVRLLWHWLRDPARPDEAVAGQAGGIIRPFLGDDLMVR